MRFVLRLMKLKHSIRGEEEVRNTGDLKEIILALECQRREQTGSTMSVEELILDSEKKGRREIWAQMKILLKNQW